VKRFRDRKREVRLSPDQYAALGKALAAAEAEGWPKAATAAARFIALTGCRRGEAVNLRWSEVDPAGRCLRLASTKTGASIRPLPAPVAALLATVPRRKGCGFVFAAADGDRPYGALPKAWERLVERAPELRGLTLHSLRHGFASVADDLGFSLPTIATMLGHAGGGGITRGYVHKLDSVILAAADRVADAIAALMTGHSAEVIELPSAEARR
jgi:integrase